MAAVNWLCHGIIPWHVLEAIYLTWTLAVLFSQIQPHLHALSRHGKTLRTSFSTEGGLLWVPKRLFTHFYWVGIVNYILILHLTQDVMVFEMIDYLVLLHLLRRLFECHTVHQFDSHNSSRMSVAAYGLGLLHYLLLPLTIRGSKSCQAAHKPSPTMTWFGTVLCLYSQYEQYRHHCRLAAIRKHDDTDYGLPTGGWFYWVSCPHYGCEILIYTSLLLLGGTQSAGLLLFLWLWVTTNLIVSARSSHDWYLRNISGYKDLQRTAIVPYLL